MRSRLPLRSLGAAALLLLGAEVAVAQPVPVIEAGREAMIAVRTDSFIHAHCFVLTGVPIPASRYNPANEQAPRAVQTERVRIGQSTSRARCRHRL